MHLRAVFVETNLDRILGLVRDNPFGLLTTHGEQGLDASHIPFTVAREGETLVLHGHLAAANAQCRAIEEGAMALAVFSGPHAYIAPGWYRTQPAVPTWDYAAVHVHGVLEALTQESDMEEGLQGLAADDPLGFEVQRMEEGYRRAMFRGIRAFRIRATRIEAQWKMSQNRSIADRESVISALEAAGNYPVAALVAATLPPK